MQWNHKDIFLTTVIGLCIIGLVLFIASQRIESNDLEVPANAVVCGGPTKVKCQKQYICRYDIVGGKKQDTGICVLRQK